MTRRMQNLGINFPVMIGPMVGISHLAFRELVRSYTPEGLNPIIFTEMLSARRIPHDSLKKTNELQVAANEPNVVPQLLGNEPDLFRQSFEKLAALNPWGFDINMGCPVSHVLKHNYGVQLMSNADYAARVVEGAKQHCRTPLSVKLRGGLGKEINEANILEFTSRLVNAGADWLTIHLRSQEQGHKGGADWNLGARLSAQLSVPLVLNGNIQTSADVVHILSDLQADGAMICRAAIVRPWILWQIAEDLGIDTKPRAHTQRSAPRTPSEEGGEFMMAMLKLLDLLEQYFPNDTYRVERARFYTALSAPWLDFGHAFWKMTTGAKTTQEIRDRIEAFAAKTRLRMEPRVKFL